MFDRINCQILNSGLGERVTFKGAFIGLALIAVLVGGLWFIRTTTVTNNEVQGQNSRPPLVRISTVESSLFQETIFANGTLRANEAVDLRAEISAMVTGIFFEDGAMVPEGELLVKLDDRELKAEKRTLERRLQFARLEEERQRTLLEDGGTTEAAFDEALFERELVETQLELVKARLDKTEIKAPFDGLLGLRRVSRGDLVDPGTSIVSVRQIHPLKLDFPVPERFLPRVSIGMPVSIAAAGGREFDGEVVALEPQIDEETRMISLRALVDNEDGRLLPGGFVSVELILDEIEDALMISSTALIPGLGKNLVYVVADGKVEAREVETGFRTRDQVQIVEGLRAGEKIVVQGVQGVRAGQEVRTEEVGGAVEEI